MTEMANSTLLDRKTQVSLFLASSSTTALIPLPTNPEPPVTSTTFFSVSVIVVFYLLLLRRVATS